MIEDDPREPTVDEMRRHNWLNFLTVLSRGDQAVWDLGPEDYFNDFFFWIPDEEKYIPEHEAYSPPTTMTAEEVRAATRVSLLMREACETTYCITEEELIATGWPKRIQQAAAEGLKAFMTKDPNTGEPVSARIEHIIARWVERHPKSN